MCVALSPAQEASAQAVVTRVPGPLPACQPDNDSCVGDVLRGEMGISNDGRYVVYESIATNLVPGTPTVMNRIYLFDTTTQKTVCVTPYANAPSIDPVISADGRFIAYSTRSTPYSNGDTNNTYDIYLADRDRDGNGIFDEDLYEFYFPEWISVTSSGSVSHGAAVAPSISDDGSRVLFLSLASDLVAGDNNASWDAFLRDRSAGTTTRVDVSTAGVEAVSGCMECDLSGDGNTAVFESSSNNLVAGDNNKVSDVFLRDLTAGTTTRISFGINGQESDGNSTVVQHCVSRDGTRVALSSYADNLDSRDGRGGSDVFVYDRNQSAITMVDFNTNGFQADGDCGATTISADGTKVAFSGWADNLAAGDTNYVNDAFVRDTVAATTTCLSTSYSGGTGDGESDFAVLTGDGTKAAFSSFADNLVNNGWRGGKRSVYFADLGAVTVGYVSAVAAGETNGASYEYRNPGYVQTANTCSADGRWVVFASQATNFLPYDSNGGSDVFVCDRTTGAVHCLSLNVNGVPANSGSFCPMISANGRHVVFASFATDLVANDANGATEDVFRVDRDPDGNGIFDEGNDVTIVVSVDSNGNAGNGNSDFPSISADGNRIVFASLASNLSPLDTNGWEDIYVRDVAAGKTTLVSELNGTCGNAESWVPSISGDGNVVAFYTWASNLIPDFSDIAALIVRRVDDDANGYFDLYLGDAHTDYVFFGPQSLSFDGSRFVWVEWDNYHSGAYLQLAHLYGPETWAYEEFSFSLGSQAVTSPAIDANGDAITFASLRNDLVGNDNNSTYDQFLVDVDFDATGFFHDFRPARLVSMNGSGNPANGRSVGGGISTDGNLVPFASLATDLVTGDDNGVQDVFVFDRSKSARWFNYGEGFGWPYGSMPLTVDADPVLGTTITIQLENLSGTPSSAVLFLSANPADLKLTWGATFMVDLTGALVFTLPLGASGGSLQGTLPNDNSLAGVQLFFQSLQPDPSVPHRLAFTPGLALQLGR
jgi:Tol biopolymer transport system component